ncbi:hypothetical protein K3G39_01240 [Pontibacter sp. HSC-14F20]|uniref:hypothetical protein n=1 Tax=Pontibacter sp. HSC-14F20 TaxID=2864136 RepID=UPI001C73AE77|nr:hypothetical protein [Pontibacter sp. HSC-14F20]MBX0331854.1 hypothetical protein [Pontibacter sp. HSC-14F20]
MDISTIIMGILAVALFIIPIYYIQHKQKSNVSKAKQPFLDAANQQGLQLGQHDFWNEQYGIGLDQSGNRLFYWHHDGQKPQETIIDLGAVKQSVVENMHREVNSNRIIDTIGLRLSVSGTKSPNLYLPFYDKEGSMMLSGELQLAEKWNAIIQSKMASRQAVQV